MADHDKQIPETAAAPGYHIAVIARGEFGEASKIREESEEFLDADWQGVRLMALVELSDLLGAIEGYLARHHPGTTLADLARLSLSIGLTCGRDGRGILGGAAGIRGDVKAFLDAEAAGERLLALVELSHLWSAIEAFLNDRHPGTTMRCLARMSEVTQRAFRNGHRVATSAPTPNACAHHPV